MRAKAALDRAIRNFNNLPEADREAPSRGRDLLVGKICDVCGASYNPALDGCPVCRDERSVPSLVKSALIRRAEEMGAAFAREAIKLSGPKLIDRHRRFRTAIITEVIEAIDAEAGINAPECFTNVSGMRSLAERLGVPLIVVSRAAESHTDPESRTATDEEIREYLAWVGDVAARKEG